MSRDVWIPMYQQDVLNILDTSIRGVGEGALRPIPIASDPPHFDTAALKTFRWVGHRAAGKKTPPLKGSLRLAPRSGIRKLPRRRG